MERNLLENTDITILTHPQYACKGESCSIHNKTDHSMRLFPQHWRSDRAIMERICSHGVGHPDPDEFKIQGKSGWAEKVHGCDGCCGGAYE